MEPTILQLFTPEEIFERLGQKKCTGCLHLFTPRESVNVFFREGIVVAAANGSLEGVDVLKKVLNWQEPRYVWQPNTESTGIPLKPLQIPIRDFLAQLKHNGDAVKKNGGESAPAAPSTSSEPLPIFKTIPAKGKSTGQLTPITAPGQSSRAAFNATQPVSLGPRALQSATKSISTEILPSAHDSALLRKHKLVLVSEENREQRFPITRVSGLIGRNPACDFPIAHASISRQHCLVQILDRGLHVKDLGTTNGTKVNDIPLTEGYVNVGDKLMIGHLTFIVEKDAAAGS